MLSNGPGDPATLTDEIVTIKKLVESYPVAASASAISFSATLWAARPAS